MTNRKYGCNHTPKETLAKVPFALSFLSASAAAPLPLIASTTDYYSRWRKQFVKLGLLGNDVWGDCVIVALKSNLPGTQAANSTGIMLSCTKAQALADYAALTGFDYTEATDNGTDPLVALKWYQQQGTILAFGQVDVTDPIHMACAIEYFGGVALALDFPASWQKTKNWDVTDEEPEGGHMIVLGSVNANGGYDVETWAEDPPPVITQAAVTQRAQAGWVTISNGWLETNGQTLQGYQLADLQAALALVT